MKQFSINISDKTLYYLNQLQLPNRSDYIEELILKEWAAKDCGHDNTDQDCSTCYARNELKNHKPRKDISEQSIIQSRRRELCSEWLTDHNLKKAQQSLAGRGYSTRQIVSDEQQAVFLQAPFTYWGAYIAALTLTLDGKSVFGAKDVRQKLKGLLGDLWDTPGAKAGSVLPSDAAEGSRYAGDYDCLRIVQQGKRPSYSWIGFRAEQ